MTQLTPEDINQFLNSPCPIDSEKWKWKEWLADVLITLVEEGESFSGKCPNCDDGWEWTLAEGLSAFDPAIVLKRDEDGYPSEVNWDAVNDTFTKICNYIFQINAD